MFNFLRPIYYAKLGTSQFLCLDTGLIFDLKTLCLIFQSTGNLFGDMFEISTIRREDYDFIKDRSGKFVEVLQCNNAASTRTPRGHQGCDSIGEKIVFLQILVYIKFLLTFFSY